MRAIDADALIVDCQLAQKQADRHGKEFANAFYSGGGEISTEWWCVEDMIENAPTIEPERKPDTIQKFHDYQVEWLKSHYDIEFEPQLEKMIIRFLHDTANRYMMEEGENE